MAAPNSGVFGLQTAAALGTITGTLGRSIVFNVITSTSETVSITGTVKASAVSSKIMCYSLATGALHSSADMDNGTYYIPQIFTDSLIFLGSGTSDDKTVTWLIGVRF